jgi:hypothetical protein
MTPHPANPVEPPAPPSVDISREAAAEWLDAVVAGRWHQHSAIEIVATLIADRNRLSAELQEAIELQQAAKAADAAKGRKA